MIRFYGLDGGQGSGKTTYAAKLIDQLKTQTKSPVQYIETDDFLSERHTREHLEEDFFRIPSNRRKLWDFERMGTILHKLRHSAGNLTIHGLYNRATGKHDRSTSFELNSDTIILVGGPYLLEPEMKGLFQRLMFLNVPEDIRRERVVKRNLEHGQSAERALTIFRNFEHFYEPYWNDRLSRYDEVITN
jgi:uridine kinase